MRKLTTQQFRERAAARWPQYDFSQSIYTTAKTPVTFRCPAHGDVAQQPQHLANGIGCPDCGNARCGHMLTFVEFVRRARAVHGDAYRYYRSAFVNGDTPTRISCKRHGSWQQAPRSHVHQRSGCPGCASSGFDMAKPAILYYLRIDAQPCAVYKIGVTNRTVAERFTPADLQKITVLQTRRFKLGKWAKCAESQTLRTFTADRYTGSDLLSSGNSELFTRDILNLDLETK